MRERHGKSKTIEYQHWQAMKARCYDPAQVGYPNYGGRGIKVCDEWVNSFSRFLADVGPKPGPGYSIDRFPDKDGDYRPGNVRWATRTQQARNMRTNRIITHEGLSLTLAEWAERTGLSRLMINERIECGWSVAKALTTPVGSEVRRRMVTHDGRTMHVAAWARETGLPSNVIQQRLLKGWPADRVLEPLSQHRLISHDGITLTVNGWAAMTGLTASTIRERLNYGWPVDRVLTKPPKSQRRASA